KNFEVIVVDNASSDSTAEVVRKKFPQVKILSEQRLGTNSSRQKGFDAAVGDITVFLDADVRLPEGWLQRIENKLKHSPDLVAISGPYRYYDIPWFINVLSDMYTSLVTLPWQLFAKITGLPSFMIGGNMAIRKTRLIEVGGFNTNLQFFGDDTDTGRRLFKVGRVIFSFRFWVYTSARRFRKNGVVKTVMAYLRNYFSLIYTHKLKDSNKTYEEIR
ncbi:MAG: glycosyltransferase family A protein, partial [bacterium]|nr:glycosyltransferase family A protein [bacterium]